MTDDKKYDKLAYRWGDAMSAARERKTKFTASVNESVVARVDEHVVKLKVTRSDIVEEAMEMWLRSKTEEEEERYFTAAAAEMNADAKAWNALTSRSAKNTWTR